MPRGRVRIENGTVVSDCGSLLRGGVVKIHAQGKRTGKTEYATDPAYYRQIRKARLNAVRIVCLDPWKRSKGHFHWDLAQAADRSAFLSELDCVVELASAHELYALIDYHDIGSYDLAQLETFWEIIAPRYASLSNVFYEIANEPVSWSPEMYTDQALREQEQVYHRIRLLAPQTHVVLLSFANTARDLVPQGNPMLEVVERMSGIDWTNASVSFHPYRTFSSQIIIALRERVPVLTTELDLPAHAGSFDEPHIYTFIDGAEYAHQAMERIGVSWFGWGIDNPRRLDKYLQRGVLMDASAKGYLWNPDRPLRRNLADYFSIARFFRKYPALEAMRPMGLKWQHLAVLGTLACGAALMEGIMLWALLAISGISQGGFHSFWRSVGLAPLRPYLQPTVQTTTGTFLLFAAGVFLIGLVRNGTLYTLHLAVGRYYGIYSARLADFTFRRYLEFGKAYFDRHRPFEAGAAIRSNDQFLTVLKNLLHVVLKTPLLMVYFAVITAIWWPAALIVLLLLPAVCCFERWIANQAAEHTDLLRADRRRIEARALEYLQAIPLVRTFSSLQQFAQQHAAILEEARKSDFRIWRLDGISPRARDLTALLAVLLILLLATVINGGRLPIFRIFVSFFIAGLALRHLSAFVELEREFARKLPALREFFDIFNDNGKYILPPGTRRFERLAESIQVRNLTFAYPDGEPVLHDVSFTLRKGEMTALIGPKGSGKSTVAALLLRDYDVPPQTILLDNVNIREITASSLRQNIALVSQDIPLADDTLRNNLILGLEGTFSNCDLARAVRDASLDEVVESLPNGLETRIGSGGVTLSSAERHRVAVARTLLKRASIVIVDDADSLDCDTEPPDKSIEHLTRDCTSLVITGRMSIIKRAHNVVVLDMGRVSEEGSPRELLCRRGRFFRMWAAKQFA